ncbi:hypothetical protein [Burkholderia stabilis]
MAMVRSGIVGVALALLTSGVNAAIDSDQTAISAAQAADMIIAVVVKGDEASVRPLSIYWKDANGQPLDFSDAPYVGDSLTKTLTHNLLRHFSSDDEPDHARKEQAVATFAHAVASAVRRSACHTTGGTAAPYAEPHLGASATVTYECLVPDAAKVILPLDFPNDSSITVDQLIQEATALDAAPAEKRISATMKLQTTADGKTWGSPAMGGVLATVLDGIAGALAPGSKRP